MKNGVNKISEQSKKYEKVQSLMHYINKESLMESFRKIHPKKAVGVDRITKDEYSKHLDENIDELLGKMKKMGYRPKPTRARDIPKDNGKMRRLGISCLEDKSGISRFDRYDKKNSKSFSFLGFRFIVGYARYKKPTVIMRTDPKKLSKKKQSIKQWLREHMHTPIAMVMDELKAKLRGHYSYYGVNGNFVGVQKYKNYVFWTYFKVLRRRGQKNPSKMKDYSRIWRGLDMPKPCIVHNVWR